MTSTQPRSERAKLRFSEAPPQLLTSDEASRQALLLRLRLHSFLTLDDLLSEEPVRSMVSRSRAGEPPSLGDSVCSMAQMLGLAPLRLLKLANDVADWVEHAREATQEPARALAVKDTLVGDQTGQDILQEEEQEEEEWVGPTPDHERVRASGGESALSVRLEDGVDMTQPGAADPGNPTQAGHLGVSLDPAVDPQPDASASFAPTQAGRSSQHPQSTDVVRGSLPPSGNHPSNFLTPLSTQHRSAAALLAEMESEAVAASGSASLGGAGLGQRGPALPHSSGSMGAAAQGSQHPYPSLPHASIAAITPSQAVYQRLGQSILDSVSSSPQPRVVRTALPDLDRLCGIPDLTAESHGSDAAWGHRRRYGLPPGSMLELTGPTGSGKTCSVTQISMQFRFDALAAAAEGAEGRGPQELSWDDVVRGAASVWMIDTEGSLLPSRLHASASSFLASLPPSSFDPFKRFFDGTEATSRAKVQKKLLMALLSGISLSRALLLAELIAHLTLAFPAMASGGAAPALLDMDERHGGITPHSTASLIVIDSLSHHLKTPPNQSSGASGGGGNGAGSERGQAGNVTDQSAAAAAAAAPNVQQDAIRKREERAHVLDVLRLLGQTMDRQRRRYRQQMRQYAQASQRPQQDGSTPLRRRAVTAPPTPPPTLVVTMQMSTKVFSKSGELTNYRAASAVGHLVPSLVGPLPSSSQGGNGRGGAGWADDRDAYVSGDRPRRGGSGWGESGHGLSQSSLPRDDVEAAMQHGERGSALGKEVWRVLLFREREGSRFAQIQGRPLYAAQEQLAPSVDEGRSHGDSLGALADESWRTWVRFEIDDQGLVVGIPLVAT